MSNLEQWLAWYDEGTITTSELFNGLVRLAPGLGVEAMLGAAPQEIRAEFERWLRTLDERSQSFTSSSGHVPYPPEALQAVVEWQARHRPYNSEEAAPSDARIEAVMRKVLADYEDARWVVERVLGAKPVSAPVDDASRREALRRFGPSRPKRAA